MPESVVVLCRLLSVIPSYSADRHGEERPSADVADVANRAPDAFRCRRPARRMLAMTTRDAHEPGGPRPRAVVRTTRSLVAAFSRTRFFRRVGPRIMPPLEKATA